MKRARILLAEDDDGLRAALDLLLSSFDFDVLGATAGGQAALAEAARLAPDVVLLDVTMPSLGGLEALRAVRDRVPSAAIVVLTSHESIFYRQEALRLGADAFVLIRRVPFDLIPAIEALLSAHRSENDTPSSRLDSDVDSPL
jgi:DNA-binding NarL/FixJ family response regulator